MIAFYWSSFSILHQLSTSTTKPSLEGAVDGMILHISSMSSLGVFHSEKHDQRWLQEFGLSMLCMPGMPAYIWNHLTLYIYIYAYSYTYILHVLLHFSDDFPAISNYLKICSPRKGVVDESHPLVFGVVGVHGYSAGWGEVGKDGVYYSRMREYNRWHTLYHETRPFGCKWQKAEIDWKAKHLL